MAQTYARFPAAAASEPQSRPRLLPRSQRKAFIKNLRQKYLKLRQENGGKFSDQHVAEFSADIECLYDEGDLTLPVPEGWSIVQDGTDIVDLLPPPATDTSCNDRSEA